MLDKKWIIGLAALGVGLFFIFRKRDADSGESKSTPDALPEETATGFTRTVDGNAIFTVPNGPKAVPLIIVYGGVMKYEYAHKEAMEKAAPAALKNRAAMMFVNIGTAPVDTLAQRGRAFAAKSGVTITDVKALGYSGGANDVQRGFSSALSMVGLIDPATNEGFLRLPFNAGTRMIYNEANWGGFPLIKALLPSLAARINANGGDARSIVIRHRDMPAKFFALFADELATPKGNA